MYAAGHGNKPKMCAKIGLRKIDEKNSQVVLKTP